MPASRAIPLAALGGLVGALLYCAILTGNFGGAILFWMASLPLFLVGLRFGTREAALAGLVGTSVLAASVPENGLSFAATVVLPVVVLSWLTTTRPPDKVAGRLVLALGGLAFAGFAAAYVSAVNEDGGLLGETTRLLSNMFATVKDAVEQAGGVGPEVPSDDELRLMAMLLPGLSFAVWAGLVVAGNGILAEGALLRFGGGLAPPPVMGSIALPRAVSLGFGAALVAALIGHGEVAFIGIALAEILALPLLYLGLGVIHAWLAGQPGRLLLLTLLYGVFIGLAIPLIVALGVIEQWVGLRRHGIPAPRQGEE